MPRFVLLLHALPDGSSHYDLMLDRGGALATWRLPVPLDRLPPQGADAVPLGSHRLHYLTHEGDIGGGRGSVRRVEEGTFEASAWEDGRVSVTVKGRAIAGTVELVRGPGTAAPWVVRFQASRVP